jgi:hypothetical protein
MEAQPTFGSPELDKLLARMSERESSNNPRAVGKKGELGLFQIMPETAKQYGVSPELLKNPVVNRWVAKRYMSDLLGKYQGNMPLALAAYNAGPSKVDKGTIPDSTKSYVRKILEGIGGGVSALAGEGTASGESVPIPAGASVGVPIPKGASIGKPKAPEAKEPFAVKAAGYLPMVGQFGGEFAGATGGALIPGAGETGIPEYAGAVAGGGLGSAGGAVLENKIRAAYKYPPVSVGTEAAWGAGGSAVGGALPLIPRLRKAAAISRATGKSFGEAWEGLKSAEGALEGTLGMGARKAKLLEQAPSTATQRAYEGTLNKGLDELGDQYNVLLKPYAHTLTPNSVSQALNGHAGRMLEITGKPVRQFIREEIEASPMTVSRAQKILSVLRKQKRMFNPQNDRAAIAAMGELEQAVKNDIRSVVGHSVSTQLDNLDYHYARKIAQYPIRAARAAFTEPQAAEAILSSKVGDSGRVLEVIRDMETAGKIAPLRRATAARIFQKAATEGGASPIAKFKALRGAVEGVKPEVFDALYGKGSREIWLSTADSLAERHGELLKNPTEATAIAAEVGKYLKQPGVLARMTHFLGHRALWGAFLMGAGRTVGSEELMIGGAGLLGIQGYEMAAHSQVAMRLLRLASHSRSAQQTARLIIAAMNAAARTAAEGPAKPEGEK